MMLGLRTKKWKISRIATVMAAALIAGASPVSAGEHSRRVNIDSEAGSVELSITIDKKAWVHTISDTATVTGVLTCSEPVESVYISASVVQKKGDKKIRDYGSRGIDCDGTEEFLLITGEGPFTAGSAVAEAYAEYYTDDGYETDEGSFTIALRSCSMIGTLDDDVMTGTNKNDKICSLAGNDFIDAKDGDDELRGHDGMDRLVGGSGNDLLTGGIEDDELFGGKGNDTLYGDEGDDEMDAGAGTDRCKRGDGRDDESSCEEHF